MADPVIRKPGQPLTAGQQSAMFYARKRRRARIENAPPNQQVGRNRSYLGLQFEVQIQLA